jgi:proteasome lid subunit RPN8/RPN11
MTNARKMRQAGHAARRVKKRNACRILLRKPEGKKLLERWEDITEKS